MHMTVIERHFHDHVPKLMSEKLSLAMTPFIYLAVVLSFISLNNLHARCTMLEFISPSNMCVALKK